MEPTRVRVRSVAGILGGVGAIGVVGLLLPWALLARTSVPSENPTTPGAAAASSPPALISEVRDPQAEIQRRISKKSGNACFAGAIVDRVVPTGTKLDELIAAVGGDHRWLTRDESWVGGPEEAAEAFGATWAGQKEGAIGEVWIQVTRHGTDMGLQLLGTKTPTGHTVWDAVNSVTSSTDCGDE